MKPIIPFSLLGALLAIGANAAVTDPVGYVSLGDTVSTEALPTGSEITLSVPLLQPTELAGTVASATATTVTVDQALVAGAYDAPADGTPFVVEVASGTGEGIFLPIVSNTADTITVMPGGGDDLSGLVAADEIKIRPATTIGNLFSGNTFPDNLTLAVFDNQPSTDNSPSSLFVHFNGSWFDGASGNAADNVVLYPGESYLMINETGTNVSSIVVTGEVPLSKSRIRIGKDGADAQDTRISYVSPVDEPVGEAGFGGQLTDNDSLFVFDNAATALNKSPSTVLIYFNGSWFDGATGGAADTVPLKGGEGYVLRRDPAAPVGDLFITDEQSYIPSL